MLDAVVPAALDDVQEAGDVALHIGMRIDDGVAHAGLGRQMHHALKFLARNNASIASRSATSDFHEAKRLR